MDSDTGAAKKRSDTGTIKSLADFALPFPTCLVISYLIMPIFLPFFFHKGFTPVNRCFVFIYSSFLWKTILFRLTIVRWNSWRTMVIVETIFIPQMLKGTRQFRGSDISPLVLKRIAMIIRGEERREEGEKKKKKNEGRKNATKRDIVPLLSKPAECRPNFSAALPIYILYIKIGGFTLLDMRVFRIYTYTYIFLQRECTPSNVSLARSEERGKTVAPYFPPFYFSPIPSFTLFPGIPLFFSLPRPPRPLFLRTFCRWWMEKVKTWPVSERVRKVCICVCVYVCGVEDASDDRWIFRKGFTKLRVSSVFLSPLLPFLWFMNELKYTRTPPSIIPSLFYLTRRKDIEDRF